MWPPLISVTHVVVSTGVRQRELVRVADIHRMLPGGEGKPATRIVLATANFFRPSEKEVLYVEETIEQIEAMLRPLPAANPSPGQTA